MKILIKSLEVQTNLGSRTIQLAQPIEVDPTAPVMPPVFHSIAGLFWDIVRKVALQAPEFVKAMSKAEA